MKSGIDEVLNLVQDSLEEKTSWEGFNKTLQFLIGNSFVKSNSVLKRVLLSIPKSNTCRDALNTKEELQSFKNKQVEEFNCLTQEFIAEINSVCLSIPKKRHGQNTDSRSNTVTYDIDIKEEFNKFKESFLEKLRDLKIAFFTDINSNIKSVWHEMS